MSENITCKDKLILKDQKGTSGSIPFSEYQSNLVIRSHYPGVFKYLDWLPICRKSTLNVLTKGGLNLRPFEIRKAKKLGKLLGLENLYIINSGLGQTFTFKDLEALGVISKWVDETINKRCVPVFASDGNFGRALFVNSKNIDLRFIGIMTHTSIIREMWHYAGYNRNAILISLSYGNSDYYDAISFSKELSMLEGFCPEGGVKNIGRLDFIATILYEFFFRFSVLPDHYFQAVGSGVGPIAIYQASKRLVEYNIAHDTLPAIHVAQNYPFIPIVDAWLNKKRGISQVYQDKEIALHLISKIKSHVLSNRFPHYSEPGGLYDILKETSGHAYSVTNSEIEYAKNLMYTTEKIKVGDASGVSLSALIQALGLGKIDKKDIVLVHLTDISPPSGIKRMPISPRYYINNPKISVKEVEKEIQRFIKISQESSQSSQ